MKFWISTLLMCLLGCWFQSAIAASVDERDMKAALLYNFSVYTTWPESVLKNFNICMFDEDQDTLNPALLERKMLNGKPVQLRRIQTIDDVKSCQVLFVEEAITKNEKQLLEQSQKHSVLFVYNGQKLIDESMIQIQLVDKRYHFSINNQAAKDAKLSLSSKLLRLANRVY